MKVGTQGFQGLVLLVCGLAVSACGPSQLRQIQQEVAQFQCLSQDFERMEQAVRQNLGDADFSTTSEEAYALFKDVNAKLAKVCPANVLTACSPGNEKNRTLNQILGPINSFGVTGTTKILWGRRHDGLASTPEPQLKFSVSMTYSEFVEASACYRKHAP